MVLADFSFWDFFWDLLLLMAWVIWFWLLITVFADLFRRHDTSGWAKVGWVVFVILLPYLGVLVYLLVEHGGMAERNQKAAEASQRQFDSYVQSVAKRPGRADHQGEGAARRRDDHAGGVRPAQAEGALLAVAPALRSQRGE